MGHGSLRFKSAIVEIIKLSGAYWGVLAGMEELIGKRDPSSFAKVMLAHLQDFNTQIRSLSKSGTE